MSKYLNHQLKKRDDPEQLQIICWRVKKLTLIQHLLKYLPSAHQGLFVLQGELGQADKI